MNQRISNLRNKMKAQNLKAVLINNLKNVYYLTNFWGSNGTALVTEERVVLFTDSRYTTLRSALPLCPASFHGRSGREPGEKRHCSASGGSASD